MGIKIEKAGLLTTVQDRGRIGFQKEGVIVSGAMDALALRVANLLVGNAEEAAGLEFTLLGPTLRFETDVVIALAGATFGSKINGKQVPSHRPLLLKKGTVLEIGAAVKGCRGYLAVAGGIQVPQVMGSASTYLRAGIGGWQGRALTEGDVLPCLAASAENISLFKTWKKDISKDIFTQSSWYVPPAAFPGGQEQPVIRAVRGPEYDWFSEESQTTFWGQPFLVTPQSDRMGYRLQGPLINVSRKRELLSTAVTFGTVQVPAQGDPIVLLADHQTTGGYPRIAQVISADFTTLAQVRPGQKISFQEVTLEEAFNLYQKQENDLAILKSAIALQLKK